MSQQVLADLSGLSQAYISQIESGARPLDRRSTQLAIARALNVSICQLTGTGDDTEDPQRTRLEASIENVRSALAELRLGHAVRPVQDLHALDAAATEAFRRRDECDYLALVDMLPELLRATGYFRGPSFVQVTVTARGVLYDLGYRDLAALAADLGYQAAGDLKDPALRALAEYSRVLSMSREVTTPALAATQRAAEELGPHLNSVASRQMCVMLHLVSAMIAAEMRDADLADTHYAEATAHVRRLPWDEPDAGGFARVWAGRTNLEFWRLAIAAELRDDTTGRAVIDRSDPGRIPSPSRQATYHAQRARFFADLGEDEKAVLAFAEAERIAPLHFRLNAGTQRVARSVLQRLESAGGNPAVIRLAGTLGAGRR